MLPLPGKIYSGALYRDGNVVQNKPSRRSHLLCQAGDTLGVIEVFSKYMRQDDTGQGNSVMPTLVTYNLVRFFGSPFSPFILAILS